MESIRMRVSLRGVKPPVRRTLAFPSDIAFIDLHLIIQAAAGWGGRYTHRFDVDGKRIGPADYQVSEEADEKVSEYEGSRIVYEYGPFTADIMYLKGKTQDTDFPIILESEGLFPPEECKDLEEYFEVLRTLDLWNSGKTIREISRVIGVSEDAIRRRLYQFEYRGYKMRPLVPTSPRKGISKYE